MARDVLNEWRIFQNGRIRNAKRRRTPMHCRGWHDLQLGWFSCTVDAAFFASSNKTGIGIVLRDAHGAFVAAKTIIYYGCMRVEEGEAMGMFETLSWTKDKSLDKVLFATDSKIVHDVLFVQSKDNIQLGAIIESCMILAQGNEFVVKNVRREANMAAHTLARMSIDFPYTHVWDEPPNIVEGLLHLACVCS